MALRSKVWPALVRSSLQLDDSSTSSPPADRAQFSYTRPCQTSSSSTDRWFGGRWRWRRWLHPGGLINLCRDSSHLLSCGPAASDIFCVTGGITAITGSLIASFGIFPKNQARIRLYLECVGCAMVIAGVLIVFMSQKMRHHRCLESKALEEQLSLESRSAATQAAIKMAAFQRRKYDTFQRHHTSRELASPLERLERLQVRVATVSLDENEVEVAQFKVGNKEEEEEEEDNSSGVVSSWIPDLDGSTYGDDHQATLEAALSLVLTVSTMAGFHSDQAGRHLCCLHHAVQHKLKARRWRARLKRTPHAVPLRALEGELQTVVAVVATGALIDEP